MTDEAPRKFVKPAHPGARIPDPAHPGLDLPAAGSEVPWDHHWIARERQGDVVIVEPPATADLAGEPSDHHDEPYASLGDATPPAEPSAP